ncbi:FAD-dependent oxidoreductase [Thioclava sp. GXIMD4215]|uniref:FAD-dependent oxidoreductase n=1 Tax=Thioclava sp. GXIMD4215 TaxID=3131928 RepID=UPI003251C584
MKIVIVGGGYAGTIMAHALDGLADVTLVEPREAFFHSVAAIRAVVEPGLLDRLIIPYNRLLKHGKVIRARAVDISDGEVVLDNGDVLNAGIVITATGSGYAQPFKPRSDTVADFKADQAAAHAQVQNAQKIVIVGAGPVGVELAAEIKHAHPDKRISILASSDSVVPGISAKLSKALKPQISAMGIDLTLGTTVEDLQRTDAPFAGTVKVAGATIEADVVFPVFGARPVLPPIKNAQATPSRRLDVDGWMRPHGYEKIFALGDAAENGDPMTIWSVRQQTGWLIKTIKKLIAGTPVDRQPQYARTTKPLLLVPVGLDQGSSVLPLSRSGWLVGSWLTQRIKGKDLFLTSTRKELGYR